MSSRSVILTINILISTACLLLGYIKSDNWLVLPVLLLAWIIWFVSRGRSVFWSASGAFILYILTAGFGVYFNLSLPLMLTAGFSALISWDLLIFNHSGGSNRSGILDARLEKNHLWSLGLVILAGILATLGAVTFNLQLTFGGVVILVVVAVGGFILGVQTLSKE